MRIDPLLGWLITMPVAFFICVATVGHTVPLLLAGITVFWVFKASFGKTTAPRLPATLTAPGQDSLTPTHADANIAIDAKSGRVWIRDERGKCHILQRHEIREWEHHWTTQSKPLGLYHVQNYMELRTDSLDRPTVRLRFNRYSDALNWRRNYDAGVEWQARLTTFLNG